MMGLTDGYGVLIGTKKDFYRDPPDNFGRYYHGNLVINTPTGDYRCAIDVDPKFLPDGVQWRVIKIRAADFANIRAMSDGWHPLASNSDSGALDYVRSLLLHPPNLIWFVQFDSFLSKFLAWLRWNPPWKNGTGIQALGDLETAIVGGVRFYIFGEPFTQGLGVHNIHQNQGDPAGGGHDAENAIWQDGGTIVETDRGEFVAFLNKFKTQSFKTDDNGHPI
jgi:Uncharacterized conserved protein (DUF2278)